MYMVNNAIELKNGDKIEKEYCHHQPMWLVYLRTLTFMQINKREYVKIKSCNDKLSIDNSSI
jgi:hypothetical protein